MSGFEVRNDEVEKVLRGIGNTLKPVMPEGWGFTVLMFDYSDTPDGSMFYLSSAKREDMIKAMKEFIAKNENGEL
jgi:hypothetical protein